MNFRQADPWEHFPYLIISMDYAKTPQVTAQILEQSWDIVVVDEAHNLAKPHQMDGNVRVQMDNWGFSQKNLRLAQLTSSS